MLSSFDCNEEEINKAFKEVTKSNKNKRVILLINKGDKVLGFIAFSLVTTSLIQNGESPITQFPVVNIDLLGVDKTEQRRGIGTQLVTCALRMALSIDCLIPLHGVHLEALEDAIEFYTELGFQDLGFYYPGRKRAQMFFSMESIRKIPPLIVYPNPFNIH